MRTLAFVPGNTTSAQSEAFSRREVSLGASGSDAATPAPTAEAQPWIIGQLPSATGRIAFSASIEPTSL